MINYSYLEFFNVCEFDTEDINVLCWAYWVIFGEFETGAPRAKRGPGASLNKPDFRFCEVQNRWIKCCSLVRKMKCSPKKKKSLHRNSNGFSGQNLVISKKKVFMASHFELSGPLKPMGPLKSMGPGVIVPLCPPFGGPDLKCPTDSAIISFYIVNSSTTIFLEISMCYQCIMYFFQ